MGDQFSQVTRRPRSKLERLLEIWEEKVALPQREHPNVATDLLRAALDAAGAREGAKLAERLLATPAGLDPEALQTTLASELGEMVQHEAVRQCLALFAHLPREVLQRTGALGTVGPTPAACRVAARLGYPGSSFATLTRALDAELPEGDPTGIAWRVHHALTLHGRSVCSAEAPQCGACIVAASCHYGGRGEDPAKRLVGLALASGGG